MTAYLTIRTVRVLYVSILLLQLVTKLDPFFGIVISEAPPCGGFTAMQEEYVFWKLRVVSIFAAWRLFLCHVGIMYSSG